MASKREKQQKLESFFSHGGNKRHRSQECESESQSSIMIYVKICWLELH